LVRKINVVGPCNLYNVAVGMNVAGSE